MKQSLRQIYLLLVSLLAALPLLAQTDVQLAQYYEVPSAYNPSAIGLTDMVRIRAGARAQWVGIENAPVTFTGVADMPLRIGKHRLAVGVNIGQESIGLYKTMNFSAQVAYQLKKWGGIWSAGIQVGLFDQSFKGSKVYIPDEDDYHQSSDDAIPTTDIHGTAFDMAAGLWYRHPKFYAGFSCTHLLSPSVTLDAAEAAGGSETASARHYEFQANRTLYFTAGCNIPIKNTLFEVAPSMLVRSDFTFTSAELTARVRFRKMFTLGVGYRWDNAVIAIAGAEFKNFFLGYSYEYATSAINLVSSGSHEVFLGYSLKLDLSDKNRHRHKSVRLM